MENKKQVFFEVWVNGKFKVCVTKLNKLNNYILRALIHNQDLTAKKYIIEEMVDTFDDIKRIKNYIAIKRGFIVVSSKEYLKDTNDYIINLEKENK